ncbi:MAG: hypothetical protein WBL65_12875 [Bryobacteraceae bacterium]
MSRNATIRISDEAVAARPAEGEPDRTRAVHDLIEDLDSLAASASHVPDEEMEALIDEAIHQVRHRAL